MTGGLCRTTMLTGGHCMETETDSDDDDDDDDDESTDTAQSYHSHDQPTGDMSTFCCVFKQNVMNLNFILTSQH